MCSVHVLLGVSVSPVMHHGSYVINTTYDANSSPSIFHFTVMPFSSAQPKVEKYPRQKEFYTRFMEDKKRKGKDEKREDEIEAAAEEEEMKMEMFYALLRRFRDARDRRRKELEELEKSEKRRKVGTEQHCGWVPSFEWEDFTNEVEFRGQPLCFTTPPPSTASPSPRATHKQRNNDQRHHSLDLNLAL
ncbi:unnamed protein product [Sphenostylis stenocarpa]|uniref:Uncharacterized protein n=1 Tax=Sphenostylis stenocarpa TaxID=92480 RepID=A0AA86V2H3_9FABA|nr:unnamed protein product [Sphenostylis stenocarpa]